MFDPEKAAYAADTTDLSSGFSGEDHAKTKPLGFLAGIDGFATKYLRAETRGIERVQEDERNDRSYVNIATIWMGGNMMVATFSTGVLGIAAFGMSWWDSVLTIVFFTLLGCLPVAFFATLGPQFGLRQMVMSRFWMGYQGARITAFFNFISVLGWTAINSMVAAQMLHAVGNQSLPPWAACVILVLGSFSVSLFGYYFIKTFEKYCWIPNFIIFIIASVRMHKSGAFTTGTLASGPTEAASVLTFGAIVFGFSVGWVPCAADYAVYMPKSSNRKVIFACVYTGLAFPCIFGMLVGAACATGIQTRHSFADNYDSNSVGGLLTSILVDNSLHGFGEFCQVVLALSTIANNIPNMYSLGFSAHTIWSGFRRVPRLAWSILCCGVGIGLSIPAYYHFAEVLQNFFSLIGYWIALYIAIAFSEHFLYRKKVENYNPADYDKPEELPIGLAAIFGTCCGIAGAVVGMSQVWYTGPIGAKIGPGADIGFMLSFGFTLIGYNATRWLELKYIGR